MGNKIFEAITIIVWQILHFKVRAKYKGNSEETTTYFIGRLGRFSQGKRPVVYNENNLQELSRLT